MTAAEVADRIRAARGDPTRVVLEGFHPVKHALRFAADIGDMVAGDGDGVLALAAELAPDLVPTLRKRLQTVGKNDFAALTHQPVATGILADARRPGADPEAVLLQADGPAVLLEEPRHLGNLGAVVRVAAAAGATGVLTTGAADPWHPAALRGSAGLHFALPVVRVDALPATRRPLIALDPDGEPLRPDLIPPDAILAFGSERHGLSQTLLDRADRRLAIPMRPGVSSLNLATAAAVVLYLRMASPTG